MIFFFLIWVFDFLEMEISNCTSYFLESWQPTQATTIENLRLVAEMLSCL